jgi:hypothetical protein
MKSWAIHCVVGALMCVQALPLAAAAKEAKEKKKHALPGQLGAIQSKVAGLDLKEEQQEKIKSILDKHKEKFAAASKKMSGNLTEEQQKTMHDAMKQAKADGKKGAELKAAVAEAVKLSDEQQKAKEEGSKELKEITAHLKKALEEVLSAEQIEKLGLAGKKKKEQ